jgi:hypothetical protein
VSTEPIDLARIALGRLGLVAVLAKLSYWD